MSLSEAAENDRILDAAFLAATREPTRTVPIHRETYTVEGTMKSWPAFFQAIKGGYKLHDIRSKKDRQFAVGQLWKLAEYDPFNGAFTGEELTVEITYITSNDTPCAYSSAVLDRDAVVLSLKVVR